MNIANGPIQALEHWEFFLALILALPAVILVRAAMERWYRRRFRR